MVDKLQGIDLHDAPISKMKMLFEYNSIEITFDIYDDLNTQYKPLTLTFKGVKRFEINYPQNLKFDVLGCNDYAIKQISPQSYLMEMVWDIDDNLAVCSVLIGFTTLETKGGLSKESKSYKDAFLGEL